MTRSETHATFTVEASHEASPAAVFRAFADPAIKRAWFIEGEGWVVDKYETDFRVGGWESSHFRHQGKTAFTNETVFLDIVPDRRIVLAYTMTMEGKPISASLATITFEAQGKGTKVTYTEQATFLDGLDKAADREAGCRWLMTEALAKAFKGHAA
ncbi:MAG: SRPBCC family protein [Parvibaculaceae bacterium]